MRPAISAATRPARAPSPAPTPNAHSPPIPSAPMNRSTASCSGDCDAAESASAQRVHQDARPSSRARGQSCRRASRRERAPVAAPIRKHASTTPNQRSSACCFDARTEHTRERSYPPPAGIRPISMPSNIQPSRAAKSAQGATARREQQADS